jgi:hypothetical protein
MLITARNPKQIVRETVIRLEVNGKLNSFKPRTTVSPEEIAVLSVALIPEIPGNTFLHFLIFKSPP